MKNLRIRYPRNFLEAKLLVRNLQREFLRVKSEYEKGHERSKEYLRIIRVSYTILESLDRAIVISKDSKEISRLVSARQVLSNWMKQRKDLENVK